MSDSPGFRGLDQTEAVSGENAEQPVHAQAPVEGASDTKKQWPSAASAWLPLDANWGMRNGMTPRKKSSKSFNMRLVFSEGYHALSASPICHGRNFPGGVSFDHGMFGGLFQTTQGSKARNSETSSDPSPLAVCSKRPGPKSFGGLKREGNASRYLGLPQKIPVTHAV